MDEYVRDFVQESEENITALNNALLRLENDPDDDAAMKEIFRTAHTLKGNCGAMGFSDASDLAHALEDLLESVRTGGIEVSPSLMDQVFDGVDLLDAMIDEVRRNGEPQTDPSATIEALRAYGDGGITDPGDGEVRDLLSAVNRPSDSGHDVYHVRLDITQSDGVNNGILVVEALRDAFDLLGTDPTEDVIDDGDHGSAFDAAFASPVGETAISAALEPVDAVEDAIITDATALAAEEAAVADEADDAPADAEAVSESEETTSEDMSVDDLLEDDEVDQFDDLDSMVDEVEDMDGLDDLGDAGSFADIDVDPDVSSVADADPADDPDVDQLLDEAEAETEAAADAEQDADSVADDDEEVEDASSTFAELKEEVDPVGFDELQDELDELEFDELDSDDEVGFDELLGDDADDLDDEFGAFEGDDEDIDVEAELGIEADTASGDEDDLGADADFDAGDEVTGDADDGAFGEVAFGDDGDALDESETSADTDTAETETDPVDEAAANASAPDEQSASSPSADDGPFGDIDFGEGLDDESSESDDAGTAGADTSSEDLGGDTENTTESVETDGALEADSADAGSDDAVSADAPDASAADDSTTTDAADAGRSVDTDEFGTLDLDDSGSSLGTSAESADEFEGFQSPDVEETDADAAADATAADDEATAETDGDAAAADEAGTDEPRSAVDQSGPSTGSEEIQSVRVDVDKVDSLMNLVEGMVTSRVRLRRAIERGESLALLDDELDELEDITGELQDTVMDIRLVPLNTVANKLPRIVRDISREQGKQVTFEMHGEDVEIDRSILNDIGDPLVHIVRNAVDHGVELPDEREAADKDRTGTIELRARRERDRVVIEVEDDGRGLDVDSLREEAVEQGVVTEAEAAAMADDDVYDLIFHSGFSTTEEVTDVSGRGVGMDVVASTVEDLNGDVAVDSAPGEGTTVRLTLPVTVAIADVLFVKSGDEEYGIPIKDVKDIGPVRDVETVDDREVVVRGDEEEESEYPLVRLGETLDTPGTHRHGDGMLVSVRDDVRPVALHCDEVRGQQEVVVKPYEGVLGDVSGMSGATVLGEGDVVNILDVESL